MGFHQGQPAQIFVSDKFVLKDQGVPTCVVCLQNDRTMLRRRKKLHQNLKQLLNRNQRVSEFLVGELGDWNFNVTIPRLDLNFGWVPFV